MDSELPVSPRECPSFQQKVKTFVLVLLLVHFLLVLPLAVHTVLPDGPINVLLTFLVGMPCWFASLALLVGITGGLY